MSIESNNVEGSTKAPILPNECYGQACCQPDYKQPMLISFSGGRTSAMMTYHLLKKYSNKYDFKVIFANTGHEREATLEFVKKCDDILGFNTIWVEAVTPIEHGKGTYAKVVNFETAYRNVLKNGIDPFETVISKHGITNISLPHCSREMKKVTIRAYMRMIGHSRIDYKTYLGIRTDEPKRLNFKKAKKEKLIYMAELGKVSKQDVNKYWSKMPFDLELKSYEGNCILCWKKSDRKLYTIIREAIIKEDLEVLAEIAWHKQMETKYGRYTPETRKKQDKGQTNYFFMKDRSINDMVEEAMLLDTAEFAFDETTLFDEVTQLRLWNSELDAHAGCSESCEAW